MPYRRPFLVITLALAALIALAACDDGNGAPSPTDTPAATAPAATDSPAPSDATSTAEPGVTEEPFSGGRDPIDVPGEPAPPVAVLTNIRTGRHGDFDRIVFDFADRLPGYRIAYATGPITQCASGMDVPFAESALLIISLEPAAAHDEDGNVTFEPSELSPGLPAIVEAKKTCDFEAIVTWVLGLSAEADFRVYELSDPARIVVDVGHP